MGMLKARVNGKWEPVGFSSVDRWNTAWGVVAVGSLNAPSVDTPANVGTWSNLSALLTFTPLAGRRYRAIARCRAVESLSGGMSVLGLTIDGATAGEAFLIFTGQYFTAEAAATFVGDGAAHTYRVVARTTNVAKWLLDDSSYFQIEDIGPVVNSAPMIRGPRMGGSWRLPSQSMPNNAVGFFSWTAEDEDTDGFLTPPGDTIVIPPNCGGVYSMQMMWILGVAPTTQITYVLVNGNTRIAAPGSSTGNGQATVIMPLAAGDTVKFGGLHNQGTAQNASASLYLYRVSA